MLAAAIAVLAVAPAAQAANQNVDAAGNAFTGGLAFAPPATDVTVGDSVTWTNTDFLVPHTVTEDHGLFRLAGTFGPPLTVGGFAPGEKVSRAFDAGTFHYFCEIHPVQMRAVVAAAMRLSSKPVTRTRVVKKKRGHGRKRKRKIRVPGSEITAVWGTAALPADQVFDVQMQRGGGWKTVRDGVTQLAGAFDGGKPGTMSSFRARVRRDTDPASSSDWSPVATITAG